MSRNSSDPKSVTGWALVARAIADPGPVYIVDPKGGAELARQAAVKPKCPACFDSRRTFRVILTAGGVPVIDGYKPCPDCQKGSK